MTREEIKDELYRMLADIVNSGYPKWKRGRYREAIKEVLSSSENPNKWIPVSERLPEEAGMYLCSYDYDYVSTSYFDIRMNEFNVFHEQVTAWMPMPIPPNKSEIPTGEDVEK